MTAPPPAAAQFLDLTAGVDRWLVRGRLRARGRVEPPAERETRRRVAARLADLIGSPPGAYRDVLVELGTDPPTVLDLDVAAGTPELVIRGGTGPALFRGRPTLAAYTLRGSDTYGQAWERLDELAGAGVPLVMVIDPDFRTVTVHRPGRPPVLLNEEQELDGGPELPGFRVPVAQLFAY